MYEQDCELRECVPPHPVTDRAKLEVLRAAMVARGWEGRPLVGWWDEAAQVVRLFTGSHRYEAARRADLDVVPVALVEVDEGRLEGRGDDLYLDGARLVDDEQLQAFLREADPAALPLLDAAPQ